MQVHCLGGSRAAGAPRLKNNCSLSLSLSLSLQACAFEAGVDYAEVQACYADGEGDVLYATMVASPPVLAQLEELCVRTAARRSRRAAPPCGGLVGLGSALRTTMV